MTLFNGTWLNSPQLTRFSVNATSKFDFYVKVGCAALRCSYDDHLVSDTIYPSRCSEDITEVNIHFFPGGNYSLEGVAIDVSLEYEYTEYSDHSLTVILVCAVLGLIFTLVSTIGIVKTLERL